MKHFEIYLDIFEVNGKIEVVQDIIIDMLKIGNMELYDKYLKVRAELEKNKIALIDKKNLNAVEHS